MAGAHALIATQVPPWAKMPTHGFHPEVHLDAALENNNNHVAQCSSVNPELDHSNSHPPQIPTRKAQS